jgi:hypothetical protein
MIFEFTKEFVKGELLVLFAFTRHKATSATAIGEGAVEILGSLRRGHCCVCCRLLLRFSSRN